MLIDAKNKKQLKITLSAVEICDYFGSFEEIRYDNRKSREALGNILLCAMDSSDFSISGKKLTIKVFPTRSGGCTIYFILNAEKRFYRTHKDYIYEFCGCEDMLGMCEQIKKLSSRDIQVSLYSKGDVFRLIINEKEICKAVLMLGTEYAESVIKKQIESEKTKEYWHKICVNTPISKIIKAP